jgi:hypothetical protein
MEMLIGGVIGILLAIAVGATDPHLTKGRWK